MTNDSMKFIVKYSTMHYHYKICNVFFLKTEHISIFLLYFQHQPKYFRECLKYLKDTYGDIRFFIIENGCDDPKGLNDTDRIHYIKVFYIMVFLLKSLIIYVITFYLFLFLNY